jgi:NTP pyrophosphatase (non-canonical NTP hydrolase)
MDEQIEKDLKEIYNHFGKEISENKLYEELLELLDAIDSGKQKDIIDEKSDVFCLLLQHYLNSKAIQKQVVAKIARTQERIKSGYYEKRD